MSYMSTILLVVTAALSGCSMLGNSFEPSRTSQTGELMTVESIVTPTRLVMSKGYLTYQVDLAYFYPSTVLCTDKPETCKEISNLTMGKPFWVEREYDRYGLPMHTLWTASENHKAVQSINIELLANGGYSRMADSRELPNGKSELVRQAADLGLANYKLKRTRKKMPEWQKDFLEKLNKSEEE